MSSAGSQRVHASAGCMSPTRARAHLFCSRRQPAHRRPVITCMAYKITVLPGDGIGPEITKVALNALEAAGKLENEEFQFSEELVGGAAIDATGKPLPEQTLETCKQSDAVLLAAIGG
jgi:isocitrate dehydrogenase